MNYVQTVSNSALSASRTDFLRKVYVHLFLAVGAFIGLEYLWFSTSVAQTVAEFAFNTSWLLILGAFILVSFVASRFAHSKSSKVTQYAGLSLFVFAESLIFIPLLYVAQYYAGGGVIEQAGFITIAGFVALTGVVLYTKVNLLSFGKYLAWAGIIALLAIVSSVMFGFALGTYFSVAMIGLAGIAILHDTSKILHEQDDDSYVAAALQLFASMALMFWYALQLLNRR